LANWRLFLGADTQRQAAFGLLIEDSLWDDVALRMDVQVRAAASPCLWPLRSVHVRHPTSLAIGASVDNERMQGRIIHKDAGLIALGTQLRDAAHHCGDPALLAALDACETAWLSGNHPPDSVIAELDARLCARLNALDAVAATCALRALLRVKEVLKGVGAQSPGAHAIPEISGFAVAAPAKDAELAQLQGAVMARAARALTRTDGSARVRVAGSSGAPTAASVGRVTWVPPSRSALDDSPSEAALVIAELAVERVWSVLRRDRPLSEQLARLEGAFAIPFRSGEPELMHVAAAGSGPTLERPAHQWEREVAAERLVASEEGAP
jgi:hypothetical protein